MELMPKKDRKNFWMNKGIYNNFFKKLFHSSEKQTLIKSLNYNFTKHKQGFFQIYEIDLFSFYHNIIQYEQKSIIAS